MKRGVFTLIENAELVPGMHRLTFSGDGTGIAPGQFAEVRIPGYFLRRPFSVAGFDNGHLTLAVRVRGRAQRRSTPWSPARGSTYSPASATASTSPSRGAAAAHRRRERGPGPLAALPRAHGPRAEVTAALGFNTAAESFYLEDFAALGARVEAYTPDGSLGRRGLVTAAMEDFEYTSVYACGAVPMLQIIDRDRRTPAQFSLEARMGCGFGACMGCTVETVNGPRRVCKDGPVFGRGELIW